MNLYWKYLVISLKGRMQYKASFLFTTLAQLLMSLSSFLVVYFMFLRFRTVRGYSFSEVLLCFSMSLLSFSFAECFARGFDRFSTFIADGTFDRMLVRPRNLIFQVTASTMEFSRAGRFIQAVPVLVYALYAGGVRCTPGRVCALVLMFAGGSALFAGMFIVYAGLCFYTLEGLEFINVFTDGAREFGEYPLDIYGKRLLMFCTFIIPYALVQYYPFLYVTGRSGRVWYGCLPLAGICFLLPCLLFWRTGLRHYVSTGS